MPHLLARLAGTAAALAAGTALYAWAVESRWIEVTHTRIAIPGLAAPLHGVRIALLADFHLGNGTSAAHIRRACRLAMRERPDLVALAGDFVSAEADRTAARARLPEVMRLLDGALSAPLGVYAVPGNHDYAAGGKAWRAAVADTGIIDLTNTSVVRDVGGARLRMAGLDDYQMGRPRPDLALSEGERADLTLLLAHNPDQVEASPGPLARADLVLSGHTHGGQVHVPVVGDRVRGDRYDRRYQAGLVRRPWTQVYVTRGVGTVYVPVRLGSRPEVSMLELGA